MKASPASIALIILLAGCEGPAPETAAIVAEDPCVYRNVGKPPVCEISPTHLLVEGASFERREISVVLYYPGFDADVMFSSRDAAEAHDLSSGFVIEWPASKSALIAGKDEMKPGYYRLHAQYQRVTPMVIGEGMTLPVVVAGRLDELRHLERIRTVTEIRDSCAVRPNCTMQYLDGMFPIPKLELPAGHQQSFH